MKRLFYILAGMTLVISLVLASCQPASQATKGKKSIVVTYSILGSLVKELAGDQAEVTISIPDGQDPHEWEPSAKDIEAINKADLVVQNGLGLEGGMEKTLDKARDEGVPFFTASDYITVRHVGPGEGLPTGDPDQAVGAADPHLWTDPLVMKSIVGALAVQLKTELSIDVDSRSREIQAQLDELDKEISGMVASLPQDNRKLVTGHESLGYFAQRYGFKLIGAIIPSITTQAEVSAADLAALKELIQENQVKTIFTELGTSSVAARAIGKETGVKVVELNTHFLPQDGSYFTFMRDMVNDIVNALK